MNTRSAIARGGTTPLPVVVLTGFLGSGKTSFLQRVLADPEAADTAVLVNEFGEIGLDHQMLETTRPGDVVLLPSGCMCCAVRQDLALALHRLLTRRADGSLPPFRRVTIETSGLAEPAPILYTLGADAYLEHMLRCDRVVTIVDAVFGAATLARFAEATAQVACADTLLISKTDLQPASDALRQQLQAANPWAEIVESATMQSPAATLFGASGTERRHRRQKLWAAAAHSNGIDSYALVLRNRLTRLEFAMALGGLARERGEDLLRVKGLVAFADRPDRPAELHAVQHTLYPPRWLDAWPDADDRQRLVFIVRGIALDDIMHWFRKADPQIAV
ncbi:MAG: CobW family GTP-binding protein [Rhodopila sp.]